jgi:hypothetical protein
MTRTILFLMTVCFTSCNGQTKQSDKVQNEVASNNEYVWTKLLDSAEWKKSYNFQLFEQNDTLWNFHHDGTWLSIDGKIWKKSKLKNAINNLAFLDYVKLKKIQIYYIEYN